MDAGPSIRTLYRATRVRTQGQPATGEWLLVDGRHIERVGIGDPPPADRIVDLPGATIIPGFIDAHVHLTGTGIRSRWPQAAAAGSPGELVAALTDLMRVANASILVHGFDESRWTERRVPTLEELDAIGPHPVVCVRADGHVSLANTPALERSDALDLPGVARDEAGSPTGLVTRAANDALQRWYVDQLGDQELEELQLEAAAVAAARGVTSVHEMSIPASRGTRDLDVLLAHRERLPVDVVAYAATMDIPLVMERGLGRIGGDLSMDGSIGARTAFVSAAYVDDPGTGVGYIEEDDLASFLQEAHVAGLQVGLHAIGDAAIERTVTAWERVYRALDSRLRRHFRARRHRIEHFEMPVEGHIERAAALGLAISVQPAFDATWGFPGQLYEQRLGETRAAAMNPFRTMVERGLTLGAGSDTPITPLDPLAGVHALEHPHDPTRALARDDALRLATVGSARLAHQDKKGRLEPGMHADFVAYDQDPVTVGDIASLRPIMTVSLGRDVYVQ
ncbi:MAG: amidohydrolase family protein [Actinomycetota bacterium]